jgi:hypothetical protein
VRLYIFFAKYEDFLTFLLSIYGRNESIAFVIFKKKFFIDFLDESGLFTEEKRFFTKNKNPFAVRQTLLATT